MFKMIQSSKAVTFLRSMLRKLVAVARQSHCLKHNVLNEYPRTFSSINRSKRHIIAALVVNQPGCLAQISNLFAARGYNIESLVVGQTEVPELSRMTVVVNATEERVENMKKQLEDQVHVAVVNILTRESEMQKASVVERDLMLVKVSTTEKGSRAEIIELANLFEARVLDVRPEQMMIQLAGIPEHIETLLELLKPFGIVEIHRSGVIAMARSTSVAGHGHSGEVLLEGATRSIMVDSCEVDDMNLPPG